MSAIELKNGCIARGIFAGQAVPLGGSINIRSIGISGMTRLGAGHYQAQLESPLVEPRSCLVKVFPMAGSIRLGSGVVKANGVIDIYTLNQGGIPTDCAIFGVEINRMPSTANGTDVPSPPPPGPGAAAGVGIRVGSASDFTSASGFLPFDTIVWETVPGYFTVSGTNLTIPADGVILMQLNVYASVITRTKVSVVRNSSPVLDFDSPLAAVNASSGVGRTLQVAAGDILKVSISQTGIGPAVRRVTFDAGYGSALDVVYIAGAY